MSFMHTYEIVLIISLPTRTVHLESISFFSHLNSTCPLVSNNFDIMLTVKCYCHVFVIFAYSYNNFDTLFVTSKFIGIHPLHE